MFDLVLDIIFPPRCAHCHSYVKSGNALCPACRETIRLNDRLFCGKCRARLPNGEKICHYGLPCVLGGAVDYKNPAARSLVRELKFSLVKGAAAHLADFLIAYAENFDVPSAAAVMPVPLGPKRLRERGFNQSDLIARRFAAHFDLVYDISCLSRDKDTPPQSGLKNISERQLNVAGCFRVKSAPPRRIILIDDVVTSGATMIAAAEALKRAGAKHILALAATAAS